MPLGHPKDSLSEARGLRFHLVSGRVLGDHPTVGLDSDAIQKRSRPLRAPLQHRVVLGQCHSNTTLQVACQSPYDPYSSSSDHKYSYDSVCDMVIVIILSSSYSYVLLRLIVMVVLLMILLVLYTMTMSVVRRIVVCESSLCYHCVFLLLVLV